MMECAETVFAGNMKYLKDFTEKSARLRVPLSGSIDITHRCNLGCLHCYLGNRCRTEAPEMPKEKIFPLLDAVCEAGCLYLLISGGEPLLRADFPDIYRYAREKGFLVTVFSNGTLISDEAIRLFRELPPRMVEISLYGATRDTYEKITGVAGSYERCISGIVALMNSGVQVRLKTILMTLNIHEFSDLEKMARDLGVKFRFDASLFPRFDGDQFPVKLRVSPAEAVEMEFSDTERVRQWKLLLDNHSHQASSHDLFQCGAGVTGFYIGPTGEMRPCLMTTGISYDLMKGDFSKGWKELTSIIRQRTAGRAFECNSCKMKLHCGYCPAFFELENGDAEIRSEYLCAMGNRRYWTIQNI